MTVSLIRDSVRIKLHIALPGATSNMQKWTNICERKEKEGEIKRDREGKINRGWRNERVREKVGDRGRGDREKREGQREEADRERERKSPFPH